MAMPKPTKGHQKLERLAGRWQGTETMHPSPWDPDGGQATGLNECRVDLNGFALITDYRQERDGKVTFTGHGVTTYDPKADEVVMHWFDCMGSPPEVFRGRWQGDVLTLGHGGPGMHARMTYDLSRPGVMGSRMEMSKDGTGWACLFECDYQRR
jgi:hypothetical protein